MSTGFFVADNPSAKPMPRAIVIDTNLILDLWGFGDAKAMPWRSRVERSDPIEVDGLDWIATALMRCELAAVLQRRHLQAALEKRGRTPVQVLAAFDAHARIIEAPNPLPQAMRVRCSDPDDQQFLDLALAHAAVLLSKDKAVIKCKKRLTARGVEQRTML